MLSLGAQMMREEFEPIAVKFLSRESLLQLINCANKVLAENAHGCIMEIIHNVHSDKYVSVILDELHSKSKEVRFRCSQYMKQMVDSFDESIIARNSQAFESAIIKGMNDATQEVRSNSRDSYKIFSAKFPESGQRIYGQIDSQIKKALQFDQPAQQQPQLTSSQQKQLSQDKRGLRIADTGASEAEPGQKTSKFRNSSSDHFMEQSRKDFSPNPLKQSEADSLFKKTTGQLMSDFTSSKNALKKTSKKQENETITPARPPKMVNSKSQVHNIADAQLSLTPQPEPISDQQIPQSSLEQLQSHIMQQLELQQKLQQEEREAESGQRQEEQKQVPKLTPKALTKKTNKPPLNVRQTQ